MSLAALLAAAALAGGDAECAVLTAAAAELVNEQGFKTGDVSRIAIATKALAPPGDPDEFEGYSKASGRRDLSDCPGWLAQMKADNRTVATPASWQIARPGPSGFQWFSRPAFSPDGRSARVVYGRGGNWGGIILTLRLTPEGWAADEDRVMFITTR